MALRVLLPVLCAAAVVAVPARAVVPPKDCGRMKVKHHKYNVKADQMPCKKARKYTKGYLAHHHKPKGFHCQSYGSETQLKFRCEKGIKVFFAIKR
jgi:hypothetical protein